MQDRRFYHVSVGRRRRRAGGGLRAHNYLTVDVQNVILGNGEFPAWNQCLCPRRGFCLALRVREQRFHELTVQDLHEAVASGVVVDAARLPASPA